MITIIENKGYLYNIRVQKLLSILPEIERVNLYPLEGSNVAFKAFRKVLRSLGLYKKLNFVILNNLLSNYKELPLCISFSYDFLDIYSGDVILDIDDPYFNKNEISVINSEKVKALVVTTEYIRNIYIEEHKISKPIYVIPTPVNIDIQHNQPILETNSKFIIGYFSAIINSKELETIIKIADHLSKYSEIELWVIGNIETKISRTNIKYFGYVNHTEMLELVSQFNLGLYVRDNDLRGRLSIKLIELMAMGIPLVSTNVSEAFCIIEGEAGYVAPVEELPKSVEKAYLNKEEHEVFSKNAKKYVEKYSNENVAREYKELIKRYI